jgi:hypothetical protein
MDQALVIVPLDSEEEGVTCFIGGGEDFLL